MNGFVDNKNLIASDLGNMAELLNGCGLCQDVGPLYDAQGRCMSHSTANEWQYHFEGLKLPIDTMSHTKPVGAVPFDVVLSVELTGRYANPTDQANPLIEVKKFNIEIFGLLDIEPIEGYASWHLDKDSAGDQKFIHPEYHLTFGGHRIWDKVQNYGQVIVLPSPRIAHPPMDAILGIDFILKNFLTKDRHETLTQRSEYKQIIQHSIHRLWKPYYSFIGNFWTAPGSQSFSNFSIFSIMPSLDTGI